MEYLYGLGQLWLMYGEFLLGFNNHWPSIIFAAAMWLLIVFHLVGNKYYGFWPNSGKKDDEKNIGCGDMRVYRYYVVFGGPAALSFGFPYWLITQVFVLPPWFNEYLIGFVYVQAVTGLLQLAVIFLGYMASFDDDVEPGIMWFKSHLWGCGWITATGPFWWLYWLQEFPLQQFFYMARPWWLPFRIGGKLSNDWIKYVRDVETIFLYLSGISCLAIPIVCAFISFFGLRLVLPVICRVDRNH